ncbi:MAG TPA: aminotransferase class V-fold PLP-dependent enzyme [Gemmatimonadales bacterium]|nr:aminotransferase class V-fold PLP-dependent enzyme [Gemmatimonadales bacterium]
MDPHAVHSLFPGLESLSYLNTANQALGSRPVAEAYAEAVTRWTAGAFDWIEAERAGEAARARFAALVGGDVEEIAIVPALSTAAGIVAANLPDAAFGENVVVGEGEFSSNYYPWIQLRERGYQVRTVPTPEGVADTDVFAAATDRGTRLIAVSAVHSATGFRADLARFAEIAARHHAWLFVDAAQAAGAIPLDVHALGIDFLAAPSHKYLLGARGMGYLYIRRDRLAGMRPVFPGWKAARAPLEGFYGPAMDLSPTASRFDTSLPWFAALADHAALGIFETFGTAPLLARTAELSAHLHAALARHCPSYRPHGEGARSQIASIPVRDPEAVVARLRREHVVTAVRAGRVRLSVNFYNTEAEVERAAELIGAGH